jgi:FkbM family methyltransferase
MVLKDRKPNLIERAKEEYKLLIYGKTPVFLLGTNDNGRNLVSALQDMGRGVEAFVNDYGELKEFCGLPVIKTTEVPKASLVVSCSTAVNPLSAVAKLRAAGFEAVIDYFTLYVSGKGLFPSPKFCTENILDVETNRIKYDWVESLLVDEESRATFQKLMELRYNFDISSMSGFRTRLDEQYFEPFLDLENGMTFVDGGGFDGQTTQAFVQRNPSYKCAHFFEPDPLLMSLSKERLKLVGRIEYHEAALADHDGEVSFNQTGTGSGSVVADGKLRVRCNRIDDLALEGPVFLKLDVEGAELNALNGAETLLKDKGPALAVCVYHRQSDFWRIPEKVLSLCQSYQVFLRHYTEGIEETVMYFVGRSKLNQIV